MTKKAQAASFGPLPGLGKPAGKRPLKVCVVTSEILGPFKNGGIGTATSALIDNLSANGHQVTILYTLVQNGEPSCAERNWAHWVEQLAARKIALVYILHPGDYRDWLQKSWLVKQHLASHDYDVVYFNEHHGSGYYTLAAKRAGLHPFVDRVHCVITHGSMEWVFNTNDQRLARATDLQMIGVERRSVEWADVVIGPSQYLLREYQSYGWTLPRNTFRQPYAFPISGKRAPGRRMPVEELVFFGRLETRKGLWLFCEALDRMGDALRGRKVTFMGRPSDVSGYPSPVFIMTRAEKWPCEVNLLIDYSQEQALDYLSKPGRVAVMPSTADNSPCVVYECMQQQIPFVATSGSGADELVHTDCWPKVMCAPNAAALSERLTAVLKEGAVTAWPRFKAEENLATWKAWGQLLADPAARAKLLATPVRKAKDPGKPGPGESVFLVIDDRSVPLGTLLDRLQRQMQLFGRLGRFALLSARGEPLRGIIEGALQAGAAQSGIDFEMVSPAGLQRFLQSAKRGNPSLFVTDVWDEITAPFVAHARETIARQAAVAVTCAAATRQDQSEAAAIEELPAGDLPAAGGLGMPITSSAWAVAGAMLSGHVHAADFLDPQSSELIPAKDVGQIVFHRLLLASLPVRLVPEVGTIRTAARPRHERHWYGSAVLHTEAMGMKPYLFEDAAAWLATSAFGFRGPRPVKPDTSAELLPDGHPLRQAPRTGANMADLARFAAALGRPDQAAQIIAASDINVQMDELLATAVQSVRSRPTIDLCALLTRESPSEATSGVLKSLRASTANLALETRGDGVVLFFKDKGLAAGTATFFDVALFGHDAFTIQFASTDAGTSHVKATIIDQTTGAMLGKASASAPAGASRELRIPLNGIHGTFCLFVDVSGPAKGLPVMVLTRMQFT